MDPLLSHGVLMACMEAYVSKEVFDAGEELLLCPLLATDELLNKVNHSG